MNLSEKLILAGLAVSLFSLPACDRHKNFGFGPGAGHHYGQQNPRDFEVYIYTDPDNSRKCHADIDVATLWTKTKTGGQPIKQTVTWFSDDDDKDYTIDFRPDQQHYPDKRGSPFKGPFSGPDDTFYVPKRGKVSSGDLKPDSTGYYAFAIFSGSNLSAQPCLVVSDPGYRVSP